METPLNAREFLKRFHLPQLVRINQIHGRLHAGQPSGELNHHSYQNPLAEHEASPRSTGSNNLSPGQSNTSISSSFVAVARTHEPSHWTYNGPNSSELAPDGQRGVTSARSRQDLVLDSSDGQSKSLVCTSGGGEESSFDCDSDGPDAADSQPFRSISAWSSVQVDQMLKQQQLTVRVPRASLMPPPTRQHHQQKVLANRVPVATKKSVEFRSLDGNGWPEAGQPFQCSQSARGARSVPERSGYNPKTEENIRLTPPTKRPQLSKLELNQPFLLYKAYKKLELCAYIIDPKNELNEKSGDPIYFPQNYPGWFTISDSSKEPKQLLETIDQVCRSQAQIFLTRDELIAYQLPRKLSRLTKLTNNQLLALPLAINLDKSAACQDQRDSINGNKSSPKEGISDIKQVVIRSGQTLKVCAIYEDVLPLIEGKQQQQHQGQKLKQQQAKRPTSDTYCLDRHYQMASAPPSIQQQQQQQQQLYQSLAENSLYQQKTTKKLLKLHHSKSNSEQPDPRKLAHSNCVLGGHKEAPQASAYSAAAKLASKGSKGSQRSTVVVGQRYARCVLLSQSSVDKLTDCVTMGSPRVEQKQQQPMVSKEEASDEIEVLIPMDQRGRFYLCATNQSMMNELQCYLCLSASHKSNLVFKLSQIVYLLSLSKRLSQRDSAAAAALGQQQRSEIIKLPLNVTLISGPRPANFSPSMFGNSSTMESYFRLESNIAGHSLRCHYNKGYKPQPDEPIQSLQPSTGLATGGAVCPCAQRLEGDAAGSQDGELYGSFSASLRIDRMLKRDVLLACTIKADPLVHQDLSSDSFRLDNGSSRANQHPANMLSATERRIGQSSRLLALREPQGVGQRQQQPSSLERQAAEMKSKPSFSRLRACRSLISLNGRRNKKRPTIPSSMLTSMDPKGETPKNDGHSLVVLDCDARNITNHTIGHRANVDRDHQESQSLNVMVEFDCNDNELQFVRTFVEASIPTSTIPDLVIKRMEFCHRNSAAWERQLKLSYRSLSQDFDSCQRQMEQNRRQLLLATTAALASNDEDFVGNFGQEACQNRITGSVRSLHSGSQNCSQPSSGSGLLAAPTATPMAKTSPKSSSTTFSDSVHSTASSRSSSGVSSAGDRHKSRITSMAKSLNTNSLSSSATASSVPSLHVPPPVGSSSTSSSSSSRLLRLVHRILPMSRQQPPKAANDNKQPPLSIYHQRAMDELQVRLRNQLELDNSKGKTATNSRNSCATTMMNAQKIHRKLLTGSVRHLAAVERVSDCEDDTLSRDNGGSRSGLGGGGGGQNKELDSRDEDSHLYESLERLSSGLLKPLAVAKQQQPPLRQELEEKQPRPPLRMERQRRLGLGKSIEMLVGVRLSSKQHQPPQSARLDKEEVGHKEHFRKQKQQSLQRTIATSDDDSNDDWWPTRGEPGEPSNKAAGWKNLASLQANGQQQQEQSFAIDSQQPRSWRRRADRLADLCPMEPISIEHDEFVSMVCDERTTPNSFDQVSSCWETTIPRPVASFGEESRVKEERIYVNLAPNGRPLDQELPDPRLVLRQRQQQQHAGRMEGKLVRLRGRRGDEPDSQSPTTSGECALDSWRPIEQPMSLIGGEPLAKLRGAAPKQVTNTAASSWSQLGGWRRCRNSADSLPLATGTGNGLVGLEMARTKTLAELEGNSSISFSSSTNSSLSTPASSCGSLQSLEDHNSADSMGHHQVLENGNNSRVIPFKAARCAGGQGNQLTPGPRSLRTTVACDNQQPQQKQQRVLATLDRNHEQLCVSQRL